MYVIEWDFLPAPGREAEFVATYGPDGAWVELFRLGHGYLGTVLVRLSEKPGWFRTVDRWLSEADYQAFRRLHATQYAQLDSASETLTAFEVQVVQSRSST
jgi:heme-degrading monooxygenase HmoA